MPFFNVISSPAPGGIASAVQPAAGNGRRNVCTGIFITLVDSTTPIARSVRLRDGITGTPLFDIDLSSGQSFGVGGLYFVGSDNTAMTLEFAETSGITEIQTVTLSGIVI